MSQPVRDRGCTHLLAHLGLPDTGVSVRGGGQPVPEMGYVRTVVNGVPVVATPAEIDITTAGRLRAALLDLASGGHPRVIVDMTRTQFCDSTGLSALIRTYKRIAAEDRELRLVLPADGIVPYIMALTGVDRFIPCFASTEEALAHTPDG